MAFLLDNSLVLESVDLSWNRLGPAGCKVIAESLQFNQSVRSIELAFNALGAGGGAYLGDVLCDNRCARTLACVRPVSTHALKRTARARAHMAPH